jgi:hypothetical protein
MALISEPGRHSSTPSPTDPTTPTQERRHACPSKHAPIPQLLGETRDLHLPTEELFR